MLTLIENGEVYAPEPLGRRSILLVDGKIGKIGEIDRRAVEALGLECEIIVAPGLIDPHQHLLGGSGEQGFSTQTPEFFIGEIVTQGITTVVGVLGADTTVKTLPGLLAKVKGLEEAGLNAFMWTGGYDVPPISMMEPPHHTQRGEEVAGRPRPRGCPHPAKGPTTQWLRGTSSGRAACCSSAGPKIRKRTT